MPQSNRAMKRQSANFRIRPKRYLKFQYLQFLSKAFDCTPHDLLIAKMHAFGFSIDSLQIFFSYLKGKKQNAKIINTYSVFQVLLSQGSILGPTFFQHFH